MLVLDEVLSSVVGLGMHSSRPLSAPPLCATSDVSEISNEYYAGEGNPLSYLYHLCSMAIAGNSFAYVLGKDLRGQICRTQHVAALLVCKTGSESRVQTRCFSDTHTLQHDLLLPDHTEYQSLSPIIRSPSPEAFTLVRPHSHPRFPGPSPADREASPAPSTDNGYQILEHPIPSPVLHDPFTWWSSLY